MALELRCPVDQNLNLGCTTKAIIGHISDSAKCYKGLYNSMALELKFPVDHNLNLGCITKAIIGHVLYQIFSVLNITLCDKYI